jgi:hypothetical protein
MSWLIRFADNQSTTSAAHRLRQRRFGFFLSLLKALPRPLSILDIGGDRAFWLRMGFAPTADVAITLLNTAPLPASAGFKIMTGDARYLNDIADQEYDVVFSNSTIEHVGSRHDQYKVAAEVRRVGIRYFIQTPNRNFPIEPHFLVPGFQFLPVAIRAALLSRVRLGWRPRAKNHAAARKTVEEIRLLTQRDLLDLFPGSSLYQERIGPFVKSFVCYDGW